MKRIICVILCLMILAMCFSLCGCSESNEGKQLVTGTCSHCHGSGFINGVKCGWCNGHGVWSYYK